MKKLFFFKLIMILFVIFQINYVLAQQHWHDPEYLAFWNYDQKAPNLACDRDGILYCAFENYGGIPYCYISICYSTDSGSSWNCFYDIEEDYDITFPSITTANGYIFVLFHGNNTIKVCRIPQDGGSHIIYDIPTPTINPPNIVHRARLCSDSEDFYNGAKLYLAFLYGSGNNDIVELYHTRSADNGENWLNPCPLANVYKSYLTYDVGIDYGGGKIYVSYLGTDLFMNEIMARINDNWGMGSSWGSEINVYNNQDDKFGPVVAAYDNFVSIVWQHKNCSDDIYASYSSDGGSTWYDYIVNDDGNDNMQFPWVTHDGEGNFYTTYNWEGEIYCAIGEGHPMAQQGEQINETSNASYSDYTSIVGYTNGPIQFGAVAAWVEETYGDLDILTNYYADYSDTDEMSIISHDNILYQNYPNPFNPSTTIRYNLEKDCVVKLEISNIKGQKVKTLISEYKNAGFHNINWNGEDETGEQVSNGIYFYKLQTNRYTEIKKAILMK